MQVESLKNVRNSCKKTEKQQDGHALKKVTPSKEELKKVTKEGMDKYSKALKNLARR